MDFIGMSPPPSPAGQLSLSRPRRVCQTCLQHGRRDGPLAPARLALQTGRFILMSTLHLICCNLKHFSYYSVLREQIAPMFSGDIPHLHVLLQVSAFPSLPTPGGVTVPDCAGPALMHLSRTFL